MKDIVVPAFFHEARDEPLARIVIHRLTFEDRVMNSGQRLLAEDQKIRQAYMGI